MAGTIPRQACKPNDFKREDQGEHTRLESRTWRLLLGESYRWWILSYRQKKPERPGEAQNDRVGDTPNPRKLSAGYYPTPGDRWGGKGVPQGRCTRDRFAMRGPFPANRSVKVPPTVVEWGITGDAKDEVSKKTAAD